MFLPRRLLQSQIRHLARRGPSQRPGSSPSRNTSTVTQNRPTQPSPWRRRLIYASIFGTLGLGAGKWMDKKMGTPITPGTEEDASELKVIRYIFETGLPIVRNLRNNPDYVESEVYENYSEEERAHRLTSGPLRGSRGFALQVSRTLSVWSCPWFQTVLVPWLWRSSRGSDYTFCPS